MIIQYLSRRQMIWLLPHPLPPYSVSNQVVSLFSLFVCRRSSLLMGEGGGRAKSYDSEKAWSSRNHSILFEHLQLKPRPGGWGKAQIYNKELSQAHM
jgi:hypothetical protein